MKEQKYESTKITVPGKERFFLCLATSYSHRGKPPTTIGAEKLNFRVRHGNGCDLLAIAARLFNDIYYYNVF